MNLCGTNAAFAPRAPSENGSPRHEGSRERSLRCLREVCRNASSRPSGRSGCVKQLDRFRRATHLRADLVAATQRWLVRRDDRVDGAARQLAGSSHRGPDRTPLPAEYWLGAIGTPPDSNRRGAPDARRSCPTRYGASAARGVSMARVRDRATRAHATDRASGSRIDDVRRCRCIKCSR